MCRSLLGGRYPSPVRELLRSRYPIGMYETGLVDNATAWGHGGYVLFSELPAGVAHRSSRRPELAEESILVRILAPVGGWVSADLLDRLADAADRYGHGLMRVTTGGTIEIYVPRENVLPLVEALNACGLDVGSTGDGLRGVTACCGPARCDAALVDATGIATYLGERFIDEQQYPGFPHKCKTAVAGCPNDCIRAMTQKDHSFVGVYRGLPQIDSDRLWAWVSRGGDLQALMRACPGGAIVVEGSRARIDGARCIHCMVCINRCPAFRPGKERGVAWVVGGKYGFRGPGGAMVGQVLCPFIPVEGEDYTRIGDIFGRFLDVWCDRGLTKERIGDFILRFGARNILREMGLDPEGGHRDGAPAGGHHA